MGVKTRFVVLVVAFLGREFNFFPQDLFPYFSMTLTCLLEINFRGLPYIVRLSMSESELWLNGPETRENK